MSRRRVRRIALCLALVNASSSLTACAGSGSGPEAPAEVALETVSGSSTSITDQLGDRPMLVSMWAVWCQPCRRELPELQNISRSNSGVDVLAVNVGDDPQRITEYLDDMSLELPVAIDPVGDLLTALDVGTVPATVLFDRDGTILWGHLGAVSADQVEAALREFVPQS
ncbi:MAG: TlpA family protein disulfide reductase [Actinomycetota bacterium]